MHALEEYDYLLPPRLIAEKPLPRRDDSRLMILGRKDLSIGHSRFSQLPEFLEAGDALVINDTQVIPAKITAQRASGGFVRLLLLRPEPNDPGVWQAMASPIKRLKAGQQLIVRTNAGKLHTLRIVDLFIAEDGFRRLRIDLGGGDNVYQLLREIGSAPLPPYIKRGADSLMELEKSENFGNLSDDLEPDDLDPDELEANHETDLRDFDLERYQTVFARAPGAVAAPTAGLHFTDELLEKIEKKGVKVCRITLHVGPGTFKPIEKSVDDHFIEPEVFFIDSDTAASVQAAKENGGKVIAVGTTPHPNTPHPACWCWVCLVGDGESTNLYIKPGHQFRVVDALVTNFHLPRSSLLVLVAAFAGREFALQAYEEAIAREYRFYSYGDAMLVL